MSDRLANLLHQTRLLIANGLGGGNYDGVHNHIWDEIYTVDSDDDESDGENNKESVGNNSPLDARTFIISRGGSRLTEAHSSGISFILVRGNKSLCVVSRDKSQDIVLRLDDILNKDQGYFAEGLKMQPFAVATLSVGAGEKPLSCFPGVKEAMFFLRRRLRSNSAFTYEETVQTAISALIYLYAEDLKANEIEVRVVKEGSREKESLEIEEIEEYLSRVQGDEHPSKLHDGTEKSAVINECR